MTDRASNPDSVPDAACGSDCADRRRAISRTSGRFLALLNRQLQEPLSAMLHYAEWLLENLDQARPAEAAAEILRQGGQLQTLLEDLLELSRIESNELQLSPLPCDPRQLLREVRRMHAPAAEAARLDLLVRVEERVPHKIFIDPNRVRQILVNLVRNAVKFTESGSVRIEAEIPEAGRGSQLRICVADTGCGISERRLESIFDPFPLTEADGSDCGRPGGLGLAVSRRLAELLGGSIEVESQLGVGSTFSLLLPLTVVSPPPAGSKPDAAETLRSQLFGGMPAW